MHHSGWDEVGGKGQGRAGRPKSQTHGVPPTGAARRAAAGPPQARYEASSRSRLSPGAPLGLSGEAKPLAREDDTVDARLRPHAVRLRHHIACALGRAQAAPEALHSALKLLRHGVGRHWLGWAGRATGDDARELRACVRGEASGLKMRTHV